MAAKLDRCVMCGEGTVRARTRQTEIQPLGRVTKFLRREYFCPACDETYIDDEQGAFNDAQEVAARAKALRDIDGAALRTLRELVGITQVELEAMFGLGKNTVARWETGQRPLPGYIAAMVRLAALHPGSLRELAAIARMGAPEVAPANDTKGRPARRAANEAGHR